jgi:hypothetical protein
MSSCVAKILVPAIWQMPTPPVDLFCQTMLVDAVTFDWEEGPLPAVPVEGIRTTMLDGTLVAPVAV